jgi:hypothetical protein
MREVTVPPNGGQSWGPGKPLIPKITDQQKQAIFQEQDSCGGLFRSRAGHANSPPNRSRGRFLCDIDDRQVLTYSFPECYILLLLPSVEVFNRHSILPSVIVLSGIGGFLSRQGKGFLASVPQTLDNLAQIVQC